MKRTHARIHHALALVIAGALAIGHATAGQPNVDKGESRDRGEQKGKGGGHRDRAEPRDRSDQRDKGDRNDRSGQRDGDDRRQRQEQDRNLQRDRDTRSDRDHAAPAPRSGGHFDDRQRVVVREYYVEQWRNGHCPPGLAKKQNGCMPPGQARKWVVGRPLPREVIYYDVPQTVVVQFGLPPAGHRYVRVAADILLIALGTGMVIDAIQDLGGM